MAALSSKCGLVEPELIESVDGSSFIEIQEGRHILQELTVDDFMPNSAAVGGVHGQRIHILSGPNASGKSIYIKANITMLSLLGHSSNLYIFTS